MFSKQHTIETNNNEYLPYKTTFDPRVQNEFEEEEEMAFYQSDAENNNLSISCIEVLTRMDQKKAEGYHADGSRLEQQQQQQLQEKPQSSFLDCLPYNFIILKPSSKSPQPFNLGASRSVAHVRPTVYKHRIPDNRRASLTTPLNLLNVSCKLHQPTDKDIQDSSNFDGEKHSSSMLNIGEHEPLSFQKQLNTQDSSNI